VLFEKLLVEFDGLLLALAVPGEVRGPFQAGHFGGESYEITGQELGVVGPREDRAEKYCDEGEFFHHETSSLEKRKRESGTVSAFSKKIANTSFSNDGCNNRL